MNISDYNGMYSQEDALQRALEISQEKQPEAKPEDELELALAVSKTEAQPSKLMLHRVLDEQDYKEECSITSHTFKDLADKNELVMVTCSQGDRFSLPDIKNWLETHNTCPNCQQANIRADDLIPVTLKKREVELALAKPAAPKKRKAAEPSQKPPVPKRRRVEREPQQAPSLFDIIFKNLFRS